MTNIYHSVLTLHGKYSDLESFEDWFKSRHKIFIDTLENVTIRKVGKKKLTLSLRSNWDVISLLQSVAPRLYPQVVFVVRSISFDDYVEKLLIKKNEFIYFNLELPVLSELFQGNAQEISSLFGFNVSWIFRQVLKIAKSEIIK